MRQVLARWAFLIACVLWPAAASAGVSVQVDLSTQRMTVSEDGRVRHVWTISSGRPGFRTPTGTFRPQRLARMHYSRKYDLAPMPHSIFFVGGYAIHGTGEVRRLGRTASHGCIRLSKAQAAELFRLVQARGAHNTRISIAGDASLADARPARAPTVAAERRVPRATAAAPSKPRMAAGPRAAQRGIAAQRRAPVWEDDGYVYGYAPVRVRSVDPFWAPRGYRSR
jgi:hypothetical protein